MTCLCLTRNRRKWLQRAIRCYRNQTWPKKELLILADGEDVSDLAGNDARYVHINEGPEIGTKRNFGSELARGEIIISWDDDDWNAAGRIADQVRRLQEKGVSVTSYHSMLFTDGAAWWQFTGSSLANLGTSLCYRKDWWQRHQFPPKQIHEDGDFIEAAAREKQLAAADAGQLVVASVHSGNTSKKMLTGSAWQRIERPNIPHYE